MIEQEDPEQRPDAQQILNSKDKWALSENEFDVKHNIKKFCENCNENYKERYIFDLILKLSSKVLSIHRNVGCDECKAFPIIGIRYKCRGCKDYDLCEFCFEKPDVHFKTHTFNKINQKINLNKDYEFSNAFSLVNSLFSPTIHENIQCDNCHIKPIVGKAYKCNTCKDYNLCDSCVDKPNVHMEAHIFNSISDNDLGYDSLNSEYFLRHINDMLSLTGNDNNECKECHVMPISGIRYKCNECESYVLCNVCIERSDTSHSYFNHTFSKFQALNNSLINFNESLVSFKDMFESLQLEAQLNNINGSEDYNEDNDLD